MLKKTRKCLTCSKETSNKTYCSHACRYANSPLAMKVCIFCEREYKPNRGEQKYCSRNCYNRHKEKTGNVIVTCSTCGRPFKVIRALKDKAKFCSNKCKFLRNQKPPMAKPTAEEIAMNLSKLDRVSELVFERSCASCRYCQVVPEPSNVKGCWGCSNPESKYYKSLLNIDEDGFAHRNVSWPGCKHWRMERSKSKVKRRTDIADYKLYEDELEKEKVLADQKELGQRWNKTRQEQSRVMNAR